MTLVMRKGFTAIILLIIIIITLLFIQLVSSTSSLEFFKGLSVGGRLSALWTEQVTSVMKCIFLCTTKIPDCHVAMFNSSSGECLAINQFFIYRPHFGEIGFNVYVNVSITHSKSILKTFFLQMCYSRLYL